MNSGFKMRSILNFFLISVFLYLFTNAVHAQLMASVNSIDLGTLDQRLDQVISIPLLNQTDKDIRLMPKSGNNDLFTSVSTQIDRFGTGSLKFRLKNRRLKKINETVYLFSPRYSEPIIFRIKARVVGYQGSKCPEFEVSSMKVKYPQEKDAEIPSFKPIRIYEASVKNRFSVSGTEIVPYGHLVFLVDASVSMQSNRKLGTIKDHIGKIVEALRPGDYLSVVLYNHDSKVQMERVSCKDKSTILEKIRSIKPAGYTNGMVGVQSALELAERNQISGVGNHIILLTDGAFNFGSDAKSIEQMVQGTQLNFSFKFSVFSIESNRTHAEQLRSLSKAGNGRFFNLGSKPLSDHKIDKLLKMQML